MEQDILSKVRKIEQEEPLCEKPNLKSQAEELHFAALLTSLKSIKLKNPPSNKPDSFTLDEKDDLNQAHTQLELEQLKTQVNGLKNLLRVRNFLAVGIFVGVAILLIAVFHIVIWQGNMPTAQRLDSDVIITLLSTVTVDIIGLLVVVVKYVFNSKSYQVANNHQPK